ncbi:MAG TPA: DNA polymerase III subunit beta [bacterium]|nr:DNA polymerase III subunit beta [bacterium]
MKFSCLQENLSKALQIVTRAVPTKSSIPILSNVLLSTDNGRLKISATNLETAITTYIGASVKDEGAITVPAKILKEFVTTLPPSTIEAHLENDTLFITSQKTKSKFRGNNANDYPELPTFPEKADHILLDPQIFNEAVSIVAFASGSDTSRPIFTGIYLNFSQDKIIITSTDGFRLSEKIIKTKKDIKDFSTIIPAKTLLEVAKVFSTSSEPIKFCINEEGNLALFQAEDTFIATRTIDGNYLDYKRIIPEGHQLKAVFSSDDFIEAVRLTNIFAKEGNSTLRIRFDPANSLIKISSLSEETGEHESEITGELDGDLLEIAFNSKYLLDFLNNVKTEKICFTTNGNISACILKPQEQEDFIHIIMPLQI